MQKAYDQLISNDSVKKLADIIFNKIEEELENNKDSDLTFEKIYSHLYESKNKSNNILVENILGDILSSSGKMIKKMWSGSKGKAKKAILSYIACHLIAVAINEPRQKVMKTLGLDVSKGYDKEKTIDQDEINEFIGELSKDSDCTEAATNEVELNNLAASFNSFYKSSDASEDIKEKCDELYGILKDNIASLQSGHLSEKDIARFFKEKQIVRMIKDLLEGSEIEFLKKKMPIDKIDDQLRTMIEELCIYFTMEFNREKVEEHDKRKMHSKEGKSASPYVWGAAGAVGVGIAAGFATGGLGFFLPAIKGLAIGAGSLGIGMGKAAGTLDDWKARPDTLNIAAQDLSRKDAANLEKVILKLNKKVLSETFIFKRGIKLLVEAESSTGGNYSIERKELEDLLKAYSILGYKTTDKTQADVTIARVASLLNAEFGIKVNDVDDDISFSQESAKVNATTDKNASVGKGANKNIEDLLKGMVPGMSGDLINNPLTLLMMMNRGGGDMASLMMMLMLMKNGTFENLLGQASKKGVTLDQVDESLKKAAEEEGLKATKNLKTALEDAAKSIDADKPFLRKKEVVAIIKELRKHKDLLKDVSSADKQKIENDLDVISHFIKPYVNIVPDSKKISERNIDKIAPLIINIAKSYHISMLILGGVFKNSADKVKINEFANAKKRIENSVKAALVKETSREETEASDDEEAKKVVNKLGNEIKSLNKNLSVDKVRELLERVLKEFKEVIEHYKVEEEEKQSGETDASDDSSDIVSEDLPDLPETDILSRVDDGDQSQGQTDTDTDQTQSQSTGTAQSTAQSQGKPTESFVLGRLGDLLFEEVDIIKEERRRSSKEISSLREEMFRIWNIK